MYIYRHKEVRLKEYRRVVDSAIVSFRLVRDSYRFFGGLVAYEVGRLKDDFDLGAIPPGRRHAASLALEAARYEILSRDWGRIAGRRHEPAVRE